MNFKQLSILLIILFSLAFLLVIITISFAYKHKRKSELVLKAITIITYLILLTITYKIGIKEEGIYTNNNIIFMLATSSAIQSLAGVFSVEMIKTTMSNPLYNFALYFGSYSGALFIIYSIVALIFRITKYSIYSWLFKFSKIIYLFGEDEKIFTFLKSLENNKDFKKSFGYIFKSSITKIIILKDKDLNSLDFTNIFTNLFLSEKAINLNTIEIINFSSNKKSKNHKIISLINNDKKNLLILSKMNDYMKILGNEECFVELYLPFVEYDNLDLESLEFKFNQKVHFYSYQSIVAYDLIFNHPIINGSRYKKHFVFIGFGNTNRRIFRNYLSVNTIIKDTKYSIISNDSINDYDRFIASFNYDSNNLDENDYYSLPSICSVFSQVKSYKHDIYKNAFIEDCLKEISEKKTEYYFFISIGDDVKNIMATQRLLQVFKYRIKFKNYKIFTKVRDSQLNMSLIAEKDVVTVFGSNESVYSYESIVKEKRTQLASKVHKALGYGEWSNCSFSDKESSLFALSSMKNKLRYINLDIKKIDKGITEKEYYYEYEENHTKDLWGQLTDIDKFKRYIDKSKKTELAKYEHNRWIIYKILSGYVPMMKKTVFERLKDKETKNAGKDEKNKLHVCLMDFESLIEYAKDIENANEKIRNSNNKDYKRKIDYICADYNLMDKLPEILEQSSYKIVKFDKEN